MCCLIPDQHSSSQSFWDSVSQVAVFNLAQIKFSFLSSWMFVDFFFFFLVNGSYIETMDKLISLLGWSFHDVYVSKDQVVHFKHIQCLYVSHTSAKLLKKKTTVSPLYTNLQVADFQRCQCAFSPCVWHTLSRACILYKWLGFCVSYCTVLYKVQ